MLKVLKAYSENESGNIGVMFGATCACILMGVGVALDSSLLINKKSRLQDIADAAVLAAAASGETQKRKLEIVAQDTAIQLLTRDGWQEDKVALTLEGSALNVSIAHEHETLLMGAFGKKKLDLSIIASSVMPGSGENINVTFVLDTTASMAGSRITALKAGMNGFLDSMEPALASMEAKVSIVPFSNYVRISESYGTANWIYVQPPETHSWQSLDIDNSVNCRRDYSTEGGATICDSYAYITRTDIVRWNGCMGSRVNDFHKVADYQNVPLPGFNGTRAGCGNHYNEILPLSSDITDLKAVVDDLDTGGETYIPAGLVWGWRTLSPNQPFTEAFSSDPNTRNLLVLMTDGVNTRSIDPTAYDNNTTRYHWRTDMVASNTLTAELCSSIKSHNIEIITIAYEVTDTTTISLLRDCATTPGEAFEAQNSTQLIATLKTIGEKADNIRLTR